MSIHSILHLLFILAWAALAFEVIRVLARLAGLDRRVAGYTAVSVALAFFLGATGPVVWTQGKSVQPASTPATAPAPPAARVVSCPSGAVLSPHRATGFIDSVGIAHGVPVPNSGAVTVPTGTEVQLTGWATLSSGPGGGLCGIEDERLVPAIAAYGGDRPDVAAATNNPANRSAGFSFSTTVRRGTHRLTVGVVEPDGHSVDRLAVQLVVNGR